MDLKMSVASLVIIIGFVDYLMPTEAMHFNVSSMVGAEDIYFRLKRGHPSVKHPQEEKHRHKEHICTAILASDNFIGHKVEVVNPNHRSIHDQVKQNHPKFYEKHYRAKHSSEIGRIKFNNPYRIIDVSVQGQTIREYVFACLARNCSTKNLERYFVSPAYPANGATAKVRFVFSYNDKKEVVVIAMAESILGGTATPPHDTQRPTASPARGAQQPTTRKTTVKPDSSDDDDDEDEDEVDEDEEEDEDDDYDDEEENNDYESDSESW